MLTCFDTRNFKQPTNWFIFLGIVTASRMLVPKTNRHAQNNMQMPAEKGYIMGSYWDTEMISEHVIWTMYAVSFFRFLRTECITSIYCEFVS